MLFRSPADGAAAGRPVPWAPAASAALAECPGRSSGPACVAWARPGHAVGTRLRLALACGCLPGKPGACPWCRDAPARPPGADALIGLPPDARLPRAACVLGPETASPMPAWPGRPAVARPALAGPGLALCRGACARRSVPIADEAVRPRGSPFAWVGLGVRRLGGGARFFCGRRPDSYAAACSCFSKGSGPQARGLPAVL